MVKRPTKLTTQQGGNLESVTGPISEANFDDVIWDPLAFGSRLRARVIVVDDNEVRTYHSSHRFAYSWFV
jgi:hypothetical protein